MKTKQIDFSKITLREQITSRGGGIEIDLTSLGFKGEKMSAYQNYLGGGMLGRVCSNHTIKFVEDYERLDDIAEQLRKYFHNLTNPEGEWEGSSFEQNQRRSVSGY